MDNYSVVNMVATARLGEHFDLLDISADLNIRYSPEQFPGMSIKLKSPKVCVNLFRSGQAVVTGAKQESDIEEAFTQVMTLLKDYEPFDYLNYSISNVVVTLDYGKELNLSHLTLSLPMIRTEYEPEQFPGLIFRLKEPLSVCLIFSSGKCVITGNNSIDEAKQAVSALKVELDEVVR
jgi:transcription initiation factor TFIID TATA-box-binding protein